MGQARRDDEEFVCGVWRAEMSRWSARVQMNVVRVARPGRLLANRPVPVARIAICAPRRRSSHRASDFAPALAVSEVDAATAAEDNVEVEGEPSGEAEEVATDNVAAVADEEEKPQEQEQEQEQGKGQEQSGGRTRRRPQRKSKKVSVNLEDLEVGQMIKGKVVTIQSYGAFVDVGARKDGACCYAQTAFLRRCLFASASAMGDFVSSC